MARQRSRLADPHQRCVAQGRAAPQAPMIGLDSNILVRYLAQDDPLQSRKATELIERRLTEGLDDVRRGRVHGPFSSGQALVRSLRQGARTRTRAA